VLTRAPIGARVKLLLWRLLAFERNDPTMPIAFAYTLIVLLIITSIILTLLILLHRGKGGLAGSSVAEKNIDRYTVLVGVIWFACVVGLGLWLRLAQN
jgi:preprotein translocase subunit SecG